VFSRGGIYENRERFSPPLYLRIPRVVPTRPSGIPPRATRTKLGPPLPSGRAWLASLWFTGFIQCQGPPVRAAPCDATRHNISGIIFRIKDIACHKAARSRETAGRRCRARPTGETRAKQGGKNPERTRKRRIRGGCRAATETHRAAVCGHSDGALAGDAIRSPRNEFITL